MQQAIAENLVKLLLVTYARVLPQRTCRTIQCKENTHVSQCLPSLTRYAGFYVGSKRLTYKGLMSAPPTCGKRVELSRAAGERGASQTLESAIRAIVC